MNELGVSNTSTEISPDYLIRLRSAYRKAVQENLDTGGSMWNGIFERNAGIHNALMSDDINHLRELLCNPAKGDLFYGFDSLVAEFVEIQNKQSPSEKEDTRKAHCGWLAKLGEAFGVRRYTISDGEFENIPKTELENVEELLPKIDKICGVRLEFPNPFASEFGIKTSRGIISYRAIQAVYQAWRIRELSQTYGKKILEIGAGLGRTAYYARAFGLDNYTIVDLPMTSTAQGLFLGLVFGSDKISLLGEQHQSGQVKIISPGDLFRQKECFNLVVNVDSITEMDINMANRYAEFFKRHSDAVLSINHEVNPFTAREIFTKKMKLLQRGRYWMRDGYCEELFAPRKNKILRRLKALALKLKQ